MFFEKNPCWLACRHAVLKERPGDDRGRTYVFGKKHRNHAVLQAVNPARHEGSDGLLMFVVFLMYR
jgi:hypothetical protein